MRKRLSCAVVALAAVVVSNLTPSAAVADGLLYQLPKDGAWVLFDLKMTMTRGDEQKKADGSLKMSSVGTVTEDGEKCRWIEFELTMKMDGRDRVIIAKVLIPEKDLKEGKNPMKNRVRGWIQMGKDSDPRKLTERNLGPLPTFLSGPLKDAEDLGPVAVESKLGRLECAGVSGYTEYTEHGTKNKVSLTTRRNAKAPFGVVSSEMAIQEQRDGEFHKMADLALKLKDFGDGAKTQLPDSKLKDSGDEAETSDSKLESRGDAKKDRSDKK